MIHGTDASSVARFAGTTERVQQYYAENEDKHPPAYAGGSPG